MLTPREAQAVVRPYRLAIPDQIVRQSGGDLLGRGVGGSVEYQDHRAYYPGDDIRHIDWRAFARSDRLTLKMYRREITPVVDVIADASLSIGSTADKRQMAAGIASAFHFLALQAHASTRLFASGPKRMRRLASSAELENLALEREPDLLASFTQTPEVHRRGMRIVVSDFLFPLDPAALVGTLGRGADRLVLAQVLSRFEASPEPLGGVKLVEAETGETIDLVVDADTVRRYRERLGNLRGELSRQCRRMGGAFVSLDPGMAASDVMRELSLQNVVEMA